MLPTTLDQYLYRIWQAFNANFGSLRLFGEQIAQVADQLDRQSVREMAEVLADVFDESVEQIEAELLDFFPSLDDLDLYPDFAENPDVRQTFELFNDSFFKARVVRWGMENPRKMHQLANAWLDYFSQPPANGIILRRSTLVSLVGTLEILLEDLFFGYYLYVDGVKLAKDVREQAARKRARAAMHAGGWRGRIEKFGGLGIDLKVVQDYLDEIVEITQRRNVMVHKQGIIDAGYMRNAPSTCQPAGAEDGLMLVVSTCYLNRAFDVVLALAFGLSQACWRHWEPRKRKKQAHHVAANFLYQTLRQQRYVLVKDLARCLERLSLPWATRQFVLVDHAIALRELGEKSAMKPLLLELKGRKRERQFTIALAILQEDFSRARLFLKRAAEKGELRKISPYWPLFDPIRDEPWFQNVLHISGRGKIAGKDQS